MRGKTAASGTAPQDTLDIRRWDAVTRRDREADGTFWFAVLTTGIYCRPSCPARRARYENVRFFDSSDGAKRAGFRPCKRCRPDEPEGARTLDTILSACRFIDESEELPSLDAVARRAGMSPYHFHRFFKSVLGVTPKGYMDTLRALRLQQQLAGGASVTESVYSAGFNSSSRLYAARRRVLGMTPRQYRGKGYGARIRFAVAECSLGSVLVAATAEGVCAISLGDDPEQLVRELQDRFRAATLIGADEDFEGLIAGVIGLVENPSSAFGVPLDIQGTAFQRRIWEELQKIPPGETTTYTALAARVGSPRSVRAVSRACAANPLAIAIPCHRVVRRDGQLAGYRWGIDRKHTLLERELRREGRAESLVTAAAPPCSAAGRITSIRP